MVCLLVGLMNVEAVDLVGFVLRVWEPWSRISGPWNQAFLGRFGKSSESSKPLNGPVGNACEGVILETLLLLLRIPFWMRATWLGFVNDLCFPECVAKGSCFLGRGSRGDVLFAARSLIASRYAYKNCCAMWHFKVAKRHSVASVGLRGTQARSVACCSNQPPRRDYRNRYKVCRFADVKCQFLRHGTSWHSRVRCCAGL